MFSNIKVIGFDADDTLWVNEPFYREIEAKYCELLSGFHTEEYVNNALFSTEMNNLSLYGYGAKGFVLSLIETALKITENKIPQELIYKILDLGKELLNKPIELLDGVEEVLKFLRTKKYKLIVATKGDLLDQERKLKKSKLNKYFHHIEVMSDKTGQNYSSLLNHLDIKPGEFVMIGNSLRSDILPVLEIGAHAIHIPFHTTWIHETISDDRIESNDFIKCNSLKELKKLF